MKQGNCSLFLFVCIEKSGEMMYDKRVRIPK